MTSKKHIVRDLLKSIETGDSGPLGHVTRYVQHNLAVEDGLDGLKKLVAALRPGSARVHTVRLLEDGDYVVAHSEYELFGPKVGFDIFRFEADKIVEHWDNLVERAAAPNPSGRTQIDGPTEVVDIELTAANKQVVAEFMTTVLVEQQFAKAAAFVSGYLQHNTAIADGLPALADGLASLAKQGSPIVYDRVHRILGEGSFVLAASEGRLGRTPTAYYDLFRLERGKIVEHWDVIETIPARETWANQNGKF
jgi:predicted SnoaL-like aldol condensation-catalyzing enzyme